MHFCRVVVTVVVVVFNCLLYFFSSFKLNMLFIYGLLLV